VVIINHYSSPSLKEYSNGYSIKEALIINIIIIFHT